MFIEKGRNPHENQASQYFYDTGYHGEYEQDAENKQQHRLLTYQLSQEVDGRLGSCLQRAAKSHAADALENSRQVGSRAVQKTGRQFQGEQNRHREQVKEIVHNGGGKRPAELGLPGDMPHRDDGVGDGRADVGAHDDGDRPLDGNGPAGHHPNDNGGGGG